MDRLYIIVPAYNEADNLEKIVEDWYPIVERYHADGTSRLVIINDGSKDDTYEVLCNLAKKRPLMQPLTKQNEGHGATVLYGYRYALENNAEYIFQTDSDGQTNSKEFHKFWEKREQYTALFGNRIKREDGRVRVFIEKVLCLILKFYFGGVLIPDSNAPFRLMRASYLKKYLKKIPENYNLPNVMLTTLGQYYHENIIFIPISFRPRQGGINSINMKKIFKIGRQALIDFRNIKKAVMIDEKR